MVVDQVSEAHQGTMRKRLKAQGTMLSFRYDCWSADTPVWGEQARGEVEKTEVMSNKAIIASLRRLVCGHAREMVYKLRERLQRLNGFGWQPDRPAG